MNNENNKDLSIKINDYYGEYCVGDKVVNHSDKHMSCRKPQGFVEIYEVKDNSEERKLLGKHNLVVYLGREWLVSRAINLNNVNINPTKDSWINWFSVGTGGTLPGDPFDPISPANEDTNLDTIAGISTDATNAQLISGVYYKKPFHDIQFEQDHENSDSWLLSRITTILKSTDAIDEQLSEAGLYTSESDIGGYSGPFYLFSRVTFPTIYKTSNRQLIFVWYLYF